MPGRFNGQAAHSALIAQQRAARGARDDGTYSGGRNAMIMLAISGFSQLRPPKAM